VRQETADRIRKDLTDGSWTQGFAVLFKDDVRKTLEFVRQQ
jgi:hypothetical protein